MTVVQIAATKKPIPAVPAAKVGVKKAKSTRTIKDLKAKPRKTDPEAATAIARANNPGVRKTDVPKLEAATSRMPIAERTEQILTAATRIAGKVGLMAFTRAQVAAESGISDALVTRYFKDMSALRDAIVARAVETNNARILAEALAYKHKTATKIKSKVRDAVVKYLFD